MLDITTCGPGVINELKAAAGTASYGGSPHHRPANSKMGSSAPPRRYPYASKCDPSWDKPSATNALREAMRAGRVSKAWEGHFPRYAWHLMGTVLYEARLTNQATGEYHAYPLEDKREWPTNLR